MLLDLSMFLHWFQTVYIYSIFGDPIRASLKSILVILNVIQVCLRFLCDMQSNIYGKLNKNSEWFLYILWIVPDISVHFKDSNSTAMFILQNKLVLYSQRTQPGICYRSSMCLVIFLYPYPLNMGLELEKTTLALIATVQEMRQSPL
jgi:hypothetical protein